MSGPEGQRTDPYTGQAVDVEFTLQRPEARAILHGFWSKRLLKLSPAVAVLILIYVRAVGPPYWASVLTGLILCSLTTLVVMVLWDQSRLPRLCRHVHVRWSPAGVQVAFPEETKQFHWSSVAGCKLSRRFLTTSFTNGKTVHVPKRAFASDSEVQRVLKLASDATLIDIQKPGQ